MWLGGRERLKGQDDVMDKEPEWNSIVGPRWKFKDDHSRLITYFKTLVDQYPMSGRAKFELVNALDYLSQEAHAIPLYEKAISLGLSEEYEAYARL